MSQPELTRLRAALVAPTALNWVMTGDSITHGLVHTKGGRSYVEHVHELIRGEIPRLRDVVINTAISGHRIPQILDDFERRVAQWNPDVVTIMIGTNDCSTGGVFPIIEPEEFGASLVDFVGRVRELGAVPILITPPPVDAARAPERARVWDFSAEIHRVASDSDVILVDVLNAFEHVGGGQFPSGLMNDAFHPNSAGHAAIAVEVARALSISPECSRTLPLLNAEVAAATLVR